MTLRGPVFCSGLLVLCAGLSGACSIPRPEGSFEPTPLTDESDDIAMEFERDAGPAKPRPIPTAMRDAGSEQRPPEPTGMSDEAAPDPNGSGAPTPASPLEPLTGFYLMRMDMYSRWETSKPVPTSVRNRVSNLLFVDVQLRDGKLIGFEILCDQNYEHACERGCTEWQTTLHPESAERFAEVAPIEREYQYDEGTRELRAGSATLSLGFDEQSGQTALPADPSDPRVWKLSAGSGVYTLLSAKGGVGALQQELSCSVSSVQRFMTTFAGTLTKPSLEGEFTLSAPIEARDIDIDGGERCTRDTVDGSDPENTEQVVRLKKVSAAECPSDFEAVFPGKAP